MKRRDIVGRIGLKDVLRAPFPSLTHARVPRQTREENKVMQAVVVMVNEGLHPLPVVRDGRLVGIISRADAVRALLAEQTVSSM